MKHHVTGCRLSGFGVCAAWAGFFPAVCQCTGSVGSVGAMYCSHFNRNTWDNMHLQQHQVRPRYKSQYDSRLRFRSPVIEGCYALAIHKVCDREGNRSYRTQVSDTRMSLQHCGLPCGCLFLSVTELPPTLVRGPGGDRLFVSLSRSLFLWRFLAHPPQKQQSRAL